jgi:hypothetical protein
MAPFATAGGDAMALIVESASQRMVLKSGSTSVTLDKAAGTATLQRKLFFVSLKPVEQPLSEIADVTLDTVVDPASHAEIDHAMLKLRSGGGWALAADDKKSAQAAVTAIRGFLGMGPA